MKKNILNLIVIASAISLTSCGGTNNSSASSPIEPSSEVSPSVEESIGPVTDEELALFNGVSFESASFVADGTTKSITATNLPSSFSAVYENNESKVQGKFQATCKVYSGKKYIGEKRAILTVDNTKNMDFEAWLDQFLLEYLGDDAISWNIFAENPADFGYERSEDYESSWYMFPEDFNLEEYTAECYQEFVDYYAEFEAFDTATLSYNQMVSYQAIAKFFKENMEEYNPENGYNALLSFNYIDQFGGYPSDFGTYAEAYEFRREQDIIDCLNYVKSLPEAFDSYVRYVDARAEAGYPYSDYTLDKEIDFLNDVTNEYYHIDEEGNKTDSTEPYYLVTMLTERVDSTTFLSDAQKTEYKNQVKNAFDNYYAPAYANLAKNLAPKKGKCEDSGYLASYGDLGKKTWTLKLETLLGDYDLDLDEYGKKLENYINNYNTNINKVITDYRAASSSIQNAFSDMLDGKISIVGKSDPLDILALLKNYAVYIVPALENAPEISVKYMNEAAAAKSNAVAYYMKSALDSTDAEHITLNGVSLGEDLNETFTTLSHEGYPGHLYEYVYSKSLDISNAAKIMTNTAHGEGWANYVELKILELVAKYASGANKSAIKLYCNYMIYNNLLAYNAYTYVDYLIHIKGYTAQQVKAYMNGLGFSTTDESSLSLYRTLTETPVTYAAYGYGMSYMWDIHTKAKSTLGKYYDEIEFNTKILSHGWCTLAEVQKLADEYVSDKVFLNNLEG